MVNENNKARVSGKVASPLVFSHEVYGEGFYNFKINVQRLSDVPDKIPVTISERLINEHDLSIGTPIEVQGQFRSYNNYSDGDSRLLLTLFVRDISVAGIELKNEIFLNGFICKPPIYRKTPFGREICDLLIAVNRSYNKSDYIPSIAWGRNARFAKTLDVGANICIEGRIQSREYQKKLQDEVVTKTAFEISIAKLTQVTE